MCIFLYPPTPPGSSGVLELCLVFPLPNPPPGADQTEKNYVDPPRGGDREGPGGGKVDGLTGRIPIASCWSKMRSRFLKSPLRCHKKPSRGPKTHPRGLQDTPRSISPPNLDPLNLKDYLTSPVTCSSAAINLQNHSYGCSPLWPPLRTPL